MLEDYPAHADHDEITAAVATINDTVGNLQGAIDDNSEEISTTNQTVSELAENISVMNSKADQEDLNETNQTVSELTANISELTEIVDTKANHGWANEKFNQNEDAITALTGVVSNKASQASVNILTGNIGSVDATQQQILTDLQGKASTAMVTAVAQDQTSYDAAQLAFTATYMSHLSDLDDHMEAAQQDIDGVKEDIESIVQSQEEHTWSPWQDVLGYQFTVGYY